MRNLKNLIGNKYGMLTVIGYISERNSNGKVSWNCRCDCGNENIVLGESLTSGNSKSCGCLRKENTIKANTTHGGSNTLEYYIWQKIKDRCNNINDPNYYRYGGRGITVCDKWLDSFENFRLDMGPRPTPDHSIDRKENDGNYEPNNCRWATHEEQMNNRRNNIIINYNGKDYTLAQLARKYNISYDALKWRLNKGLSVEDAIEFTLESRAKTYNAVHIPDSV